MLRRILTVGCITLSIVWSGDLASAEDCTVGTTTTISSYLTNYMKTGGTAVAYAWTGGHYLGGTNWGHRTNQGDVITTNTTGGWAISGPFSTDYQQPHPGQFDTSNAEAKAQCAGANCSTPTLVTNACVTRKKDSAGAGAYARAGTIAAPEKEGDKRGTATISIPNRMTLSGSVGDVTGVWALVISVERGVKTSAPNPSNAPKESLSDVHPWMIDKLGLKGESFKVHPANNRDTMFAVGFELDPAGTKVKVIEPIFSDAWKDPNQKHTVQKKFASLALQFKIQKCKQQSDGKCHVASYHVADDQIEVPIEWKESGANMFFIEVGQAGREETLTHPKP